MFRDGASYGDGKVESFMVTEVMHFQALEPKSALSAFRSVSNDKVLSP